MFERFTERAREVVVLAQDESRLLKHNYIGTEHLLLGLVRMDEGIASRVLMSLGVGLGEARALVISVVGTGEEVAFGQIPFTPEAKECFDFALREALALGHNYIGTEHLLLGLLRGKDEGPAPRVLREFDLEAETIRNAVIETLATGMRDTPVKQARHSERPIRLEHVLAALHETKEALIEANEFEEAARVRNQQRRLEEAIRETQELLLQYKPAHAPSAIGEGAGRWQYTIVTLDGPSAAWPQQLAELRREGWELLTIIDEGKDRRALLERRTGS
jgi:ATP-dependent Clp protease ATP-binding subunit ClpA